MYTLRGMETMKKTDWLMLGGLGVLWGGAFIFNGIALADWPTLTVVAARTGIAALVLWIVMAVTRRRLPLTARNAGRFLIMGLLNNVIPFSLIVWAQTSITAGTASILNATTPLFTIIAAHWLTNNEKLNARRLVGVIIGIAGVVILVGKNTVGDGGTLLHKFAVLGAGLSYSMAGIYGKRFKADGLDPIVVSTGQLTASFAVLLPLSLLVDRVWTLPPPGGDTILALLGLATMSTALAYILYFRLLGRAGAGNTLLVTMIIPFVAVFLGTIVFGDKIEGRQLTALGILIVGLLVIDGRLFRRRFPL
jgi:drug/metabolite transporter (DMT)-like permease